MTKQNTTLVVDSADVPITETILLAYHSICHFMELDTSYFQAFLEDELHMSPCYARVLISKVPILDQMCKSLDSEFHEDAKELLETWIWPPAEGLL